MYSLARLLRLTAIAIAAFALTACASTGVSSYLERGADFTRYRTYNWAAAEAFDTGDPRLDNNPFFHERIQADVEKELANRGFEKTTSGRPDLVIRYHATVRQQAGVHNVDPDKAYCDSNNCEAYVYEAGTLLLDFVDARTDKLVWRGWAEDAVDGVIDNQRLLEQRIDKAVALILRRLPGRLYLGEI